MAIVIENVNIAPALNSGSAGTTGTITTNVTCAAGTTIAVVSYNLNAAATFSDNSGNGYTWSVDISRQNTCFVAIGSVYATSGLASGTVITADYGGNSTERQLAGISWTGGATSSRVDQTNSNTAFGSGAAWATASITPTVSDSIVFGAFGDFGTSGAITSTPTSPWLEWTDLDNGANMNMTAVYQIVSDMTARQPAGTFSASMIGDEAGVTVNYKAAPPAPTASVVAWTVA